MSFGLKTVLSLFQKALTKIFSPIQHQALIYINDILLFFENDKDHADLLSRFHQLVKAHGIMLLEKKMLLAQSSIEFLRMTIFNGSYVPQPHIGIHLQDFPDERLSKKQL